ncbi:hypothetical protein Ahy_B02g058374 [Arachis hypogaea]|uniref:Protein FAR1-RELATED SEQUENCE n=1 Tax=Arachis hypogaea TaxID=3818 RepID=A0A445AEI2_ARAHY|nr:hypothetical protein Ahy_B02g058374 [Arachis hypogaea]
MAARDKFAPNNNTCTQKMTNIIKLMYDHLWARYTKILAETREGWFQKWALNFIWALEHDLTIRKIFDHRMSRRLLQMLDDAWLRPDIKKALFVYWETDEGFRHRRLTNRANRASFRSSKYTGNSAAIIKAMARLSKLLDSEATLAETFKYTHTLKENKETFESYTQRLEFTIQQSQ